MCLEIAMEYEEILLGKRKKYSSRFKGENLTQKDIRDFADYVFREILGWTPHMVRDHLNEEIIEKMHLTTIFKNIKFPQGVSIKDGYYIAYFTYPEIFKASNKDIIIRTYETHIKKRQMRNYPGFFVGADGEVNAKVIMQHVIRYYLVPTSIESMYEFFAGSEKLDGFMKTYSLYTPMRAFFESPLEYMYESLDDTQKNEVLYQKLKFDRILKEDWIEKNKKAKKDINSCSQEAAK